MTPKKVPPVTNWKDKISSKLPPKTPEPKKKAPVPRDGTVRG